MTSNSLTTHELREITIVGGGPTGIFGLFYAGMRGATAQLVDALPELGGQLTALYPEKFIFDVAGFPRILAKDLVKELGAQAAQFNQPVHLHQNITGLEEADGHFVLCTETDRFPTRAIVIAAGIGAFSPRRLPQTVAEPWYGRGIDDVVLDPSKYHGRNIVIIGGGDTAFDWASQLAGKATHVHLVHRTDRFRAHQATVDAVHRAVGAGQVTLHTFHELADIHADGERFDAISVRHTKRKEVTRLPCDAVLPMLGFVSDLGTLLTWGMTVEKDEIVVNSMMETGRAGIWAAGDVTTYPGKLKLIAAGFSEAATAVNQAVHWMHPDKKVAPGHSSNMAIFGQKDD